MDKVSCSKNIKLYFLSADTRKQTFIQLSQKKIHKMPNICKDSRKNNCSVHVFQFLYDVGALGVNLRKAQGTCMRLESLEAISYRFPILKMADYQKIRKNDLIITYLMQPKLITFNSVSVPNILIKFGTKSQVD